jgi:FemAB-related protein (PEP-CTERM system-associated)
MQISLCKNAADAERWQEFVETHIESTNYHRWRWKQVIENSFGWPTFYLMAEEGAQVRGILPLSWQKSWLFGSFVSSLPFLSAGGIVAETKAAEQRLLDEAISLTQQLKADYLELRYLQDPGLKLPVKTNKWSAVVSVEPDSAKMWDKLDNKVRNCVRKSMTYGLTAEFGHEELVNDFYAVFAENMRHFGTPVYGRRFFLEILRAFPNDSHICVVRHQGRTVATTFFTSFRDTIESKWTCSLEAYLSLKPNMFLTWNAFCFAGHRGYRRFDFGRSLVGSGTYRFKMQWGCQAVPLYWVYWLSNGNPLPGLNVQNPKYQTAMRVWQKLPLAITNRLGPGIVKYLPS